MKAGISRARSGSARLLCLFREINCNKYYVTIFTFKIDNMILNEETIILVKKINECPHSNGIDHWGGRLTHLEVADRQQECNA